MADRLIIHLGSGGPEKESSLVKRSVIIKSTNQRSVRSSDWFLIDGQPLDEEFLCRPITLNTWCPRRILPLESWCSLLRRLFTFTSRPFQRLRTISSSFACLKRAVNRKWTAGHVQCNSLWTGRCERVYLSKARVKMSVRQECLVVQWAISSGEEDF